MPTSGNDRGNEGVEYKGLFAIDAVHVCGQFASLHLYYDGMNCRFILSPKAATNVAFISGNEILCARPCCSLGE